MNNCVMAWHKLKINLCYSIVTVEHISFYKLVNTKNVIVTPCCVSLAIRQSPDRTGYQTYANTS